MKGLIIICLLQLLVHVQGRCHPNDYFGSCRCRGSSIKCESNVNLKRIFGNRFLVNEYEEIKLKKTNLIQINRDDFSSSLQFRKIRIKDNRFLNDIDPLAFGVSNFTVLLEVEDNRGLRGNNVFKLVKNLPRLRDVEIRENGITEIPKNAFKPDDDSENQWLTTLNLRDNKIRTVGENAFANLVNIKIIDLGYNDIVTIEDYGLTLSRKALVNAVYLRFNYLTQESFTNLSLFNQENTIRNLFLEGNRFTTFPNEKFGSYINDKRINYVYMNANNLTCDCQLEWIYNFKNTSEQNRFDSFMCGDSRNIFQMDAGLFNNCRANDVTTAQAIKSNATSVTEVTSVVVEVTTDVSDDLIDPRKKENKPVVGQ